MARSLNKVSLIGNLTRDPDLRFTPQGAAVCSFGVATNRQWKTESGEKKEDVEFHNIVCWNKLAEICGQLLGKGRKVFVEGRLKTRRWEAQDGTPRTTTEVVITEMILLDNKGAGGGNQGRGDDFDVPENELDQVPSAEVEEKKSGKAEPEEKKEKPKPEEKTEVKEDDDIPF